MIIFDSSSDKSDFSQNFVLSRRIRTFLALNWEILGPTWLLNLFFSKSESREYECRRPRWNRSLSGKSHINLSLFLTGISLDFSGFRGINTMTPRPWPGAFWNYLMKPNDISRIAGHPSFDWKEFAFGRGRVWAVIKPTGRCKPAHFQRAQ